MFRAGSLLFFFFKFGSRSMVNHLTSSAGNHETVHDLFEQAYYFPYCQLNSLIRGANGLSPETSAACCSVNEKVPRSL